MLFVDGSNLLTELGVGLGIEIRSERPTKKALQLACLTADKALAELFSAGQIGAHLTVRKYWFGSVQGSDEDMESKAEFLRSSGYEAVLFHKVKGRKEKGVDLAVAREMLIHGFHRNYDMAVLIAGDEDYLGLVGDLKRLGLVVAVAFYGSAALSRKLKLASDAFALLQEPHAVHDNLAKAVLAERAA